MMRAWRGLAAVLLVAGCAGRPEQYSGTAEPVAEEAVVAEPSVVVPERSVVADCDTGDDGIGGTGCQTE